MWKKILVLLAIIAIVGVGMTSFLKNYNVKIAITTKQHQTKHPKRQLQTDWSKQNVVVFGDSVSVGYSGIANHADTNAWTYQVAKKLKFHSFTNYAVNAATITGNDTTKDFLGQIQRFQMSKTADSATVAIIALGVNDINLTKYTPAEVAKQLNYYINELKAMNSKLVIYGVDPMANYILNDKKQNTKNAVGYTASAYIQAINQVYHQKGIQVYDWEKNPIVTDANHQKMYGDHVIHPTQTTQDKMAQRIAKWLSKQ